MFMARPIKIIIDKYNFFELQYNNILKKNIKKSKPRFSKIDVNVESGGTDLLIFGINSK